MGFGGMSVWSLLLILVIVLVLFGTKKLRNIGTDLGGAIKGFKQAMNDGQKEDSKPSDQIEQNRSETAGTDNAGDAERDKQQSSS